MAGALLLSFDDRWLPTWTAALPLFAARRARATFFISAIHNFISEEAAQLRAIQDAGHAIGCHTLRHVRAAEYAEKCGVPEYLREEVYPALRGLWGYGLHARSFSYPANSHTTSTDAALLRCFHRVRSGSFVPAGQAATFERLYTPRKRFAQTKFFWGMALDALCPATWEDVEASLRRAALQQEVVSLTAHGIGGGNKRPVSVERLEQVLDLAQQLGLEFLTYHDELPPL